MARSRFRRELVFSSPRSLDIVFLLVVYWIASLVPVACKEFGYRHNNVNDCNVVILSSRSKNGTITSVNYPNTYPSHGTACIYTFQGQGRERVQIEFTDFDLYYTHSDKQNPINCQGVDSLIVSAPIDNTIVDLYSFCGQKKIPLLMSSGIRTSFKFTSTSDAVNVRGFSANYRFVTVCGFTYSSSRAMNGTFTSPNYPGYYPRNVECQYFFYGDVNQKVRITFDTFNVEGMPPVCTEKSNSDYIEFSNFAVNVRDGKMKRYCGARKTHLIEPVESDGRFFRVTFKSNHIYDGTGFEARYTFLRYDDPSSTKQVHDNAGNEQSSYTILITLSAFFYSLLISS